MLRSAHSGLHRIAAGLALLGVMLHVTLLPWHEGLRVAARHQLATLTADLGALCHGGRVSDTDERAPTTPRPGAPDCPVCLGLAASQLAVAVAVEPLARPNVRTLARVLPRDDVAHGASSVEPRSRGPPAPSQPG